MMYKLIFFVSFFTKYSCGYNCLKLNNKGKNFVSVMDMAPFNRIQNEALKESYEKEKHNFNEQPIRLLFHEDSGIITAINNNSGVTGFFGEIWTFLAKHANFTLVIKKVPEKRIGIRPSFTSSYNGLLRYIEHAEADIIARIEVYQYWSDVVDFFLPLWNDRYRLFIQLSYKENLHWISDLFSYEVWTAIGAIHILFFVASVFTELCTVKYEKDKRSIVSYKDYMLYYHGIFTQRSYFLLHMQKSRRILNSSACLFSVLILNFYSAKILLVLLNRPRFQPFDGLDSLYRKSDYFVLSEKDSVVHLSYEFLQTYEDLEPNHELRNIIRSKRIMFCPTRQRMYRIGCTTEKNYALFESEHLKKNVEKYGCTFKALGKGYFHTFVAGGVRKNFTPYKRTIDLGILKLFESGLLNALKHRLIGLNKSNSNNIFEPITFEKVYMIIIVFLMGTILSFLILFVELLVYFLTKKSKGGNC